MNSVRSEERPLRAGIIQSNYIPWKGYFDFIDSVDAFVMLDDVQYTRRDWRNRNRIKTREGLQWLTIPVVVKGKYFQRIDETLISDSLWADDHLNRLRHAYGHAPYFRSEWPLVESLYRKCRSFSRLTDVNETLLRGLCRRLEITTPIYRSSDFTISEGKNERLIELCRQLGANEYLCGPAARAYMDAAEWSRNGIEVAYKSYAGYPEYDQVHPPFEHGVTILDVLFHAGERAREYIKSQKDIE